MVDIKEPFAYFKKSHETGPMAALVTALAAAFGCLGSME
jgi:hypothetical protein